MCKAKTPKVEPVAPPPMAVPTVTSEEVTRKRDRERDRARAAFGRQSTILGGEAGTAGAPTAQAKTLLGV